MKIMFDCVVKEIEMNRIKKKWKYGFECSKLFGRREKTTKMI